MSRAGLPCFVLAAVVLGLMSGMTGPARALDAPVGKRPFDVLVNGAKVGHEFLTFRHEGKVLVVDDEIVITVPRMVNSPLLNSVTNLFTNRYMLRCHEVWRDGTLAEVTSDINNYDEPLEVDLDATASGLMVNGPAGRLPAPPGLVPSTLWSIEMTKAPAVLDLDSGRILNVHFAQGAQVPLPIGRKDLPAIHVTASGELARELWYAGGILVREQYVDKKGQLLEIRYAP